MLLFLVRSTTSLVFMLAGRNILAWNTMESETAKLLLNNKNFHSKTFELFDLNKLLSYLEQRTHIHLNRSTFHFVPLNIAPY